MKKEITVYGGLMSTQPDNADICLVSTIIQDGIKNYEELIEKFAVCKRKSMVESEKRIEAMKEEGKIGYYHSQYNVINGKLLYYFTRWSPEQGSFPESSTYKNKESYFKPFFREAK